MQAKICDTTSCFLCKCSSPAWKMAIVANKTTLTFKKGQPIFLEGDAVEGLYFIFKGMAKVHKQWGEQKELIIRFVKTGDVLGHRGLVESGIYPVSATALEHTSACFITNDFLEASLQTNPLITYKLMELYATELQKAEKKMINLAHMEVKGRIAEAVLELRNFFGITPQGFIDVSLTRQDIASFAGTTYETVFKIFTELIQAKLIKTVGKYIAILNETAMKSLIKINTKKI